MGARWTKTEDDRLASAWKRGGLKAATSEFAGERTETSVKARANITGVSGVEFDTRDAAHHQLSHEPISELDRIGLYPWGYMTLKGDLRPMVRVELEVMA